MQSESGTYLDLSSSLQFCTLVWWSLVTWNWAHRPLTTTVTRHGRHGGDWCCWLYWSFWWFSITVGIIIGNAVSTKGGEQGGKVQASPKVFLWLQILVDPVAGACFSILSQHLPWTEKVMNSFSWFLLIAFSAGYLLLNPCGESVMNTESRKKRKKEGEKPTPNKHTSCMLWQYEDCPEFLFPSGREFMTSTSPKKNPPVQPFLCCFSLKWMAKLLR